MRRITTARYRTSIHDIDKLAERIGKRRLSAHNKAMVGLSIHPLIVELSNDAMMRVDLDDEQQRECRQFLERLGPRWVGGKSWKKLEEGSILEAMRSACEFVNLHRYDVRYIARKLFHVGIDDKQETQCRQNLLGLLREAGPANAHEADVLFAAALESAPNMRAPIEALWKSSRDIRGGVFTMRPTILTGSPGLGKSHLARLIGKLGGLETLVIDATAGASAFRIAGVEKGWRGASQSEILGFMGEKKICNPIVVIDELDKAGNGDANVVASFNDSLLALLEPGTAKRWMCPASKVEFDMSHISWIITVNDAGRLSAPLRSRCKIVEVEPISAGNVGAVARSVAVECGHPDPDLFAEAAGLGFQPGVSVRDLQRVANEFSVQKPDFYLH